MDKPDGYDAIKQDLFYEQVREAIEGGIVRPQISTIRRHFKCGYRLAADIIEALEYDLVITPADRNGTRELMPNEKQTH